MGNNHLNDELIARCAESIIMTGSVNFSKQVQEHFRTCMTCSVAVQVKLDEMKDDYKKKIYNNLVGSSLCFNIVGK